MASPTITSATQFMGRYYDRFFLDNLYPDLYLWQFGDKRRVPPNSGKVINFSRYKKLTHAGAITEGTIVNPSSMSATRVSGTLAGNAVAVSHNDFLIMTGISDIVSDSVREVARALALRIETVIRSTVSAGGTILGASNAAIIGGVAPKLDAVGIGFQVRATDVIKMVTKLRKNDAKTFPDGNFVGIGHPNFFHDLQTLTSAGNWIDVNKYATNNTVDQIYRGEIGRLYGVRWVESSVMPKLLGGAGNSANTGLSGVGGSGYHAWVLGPGAYGVVELDGGSAKTFIKQLGSGGTNDPVNQLATVGAKIYFTAVDMDTTNRMIRLVHNSENV